MSKVASGSRNRVLPLGTIVLGIVLLIQSFGWISSRFNWIFPAIVLVVGAILLVRANLVRGASRKGVLSALVLVVIGALLLLVTLGSITGAWVLPTVVILLGLAMLRDV